MDKIFSRRQFSSLSLLGMIVSGLIRVAKVQAVEDLSSGKYSVNGVLTIQGIEGILINILAIAISGIGFAGFVMLIIGSFQFLLSGGNPKGTEGGRNTMTYALVGLLVALSSWIILNTIAFFTGVQAIKFFDICYGGIC